MKRKEVFLTFTVLTLFFSLLLPFLSLVTALGWENLSLASASTFVSGTINKNTVWKVADSPFVVTGNITVDTNVALTIEPGVMVKFSGYYYLMVKGTLSAIGSENAPITFTSNASSPSLDDWKGIESSGFNSKMNFKHTKIEFASTGIYNNNGYLSIANSEISLNNVGIYYFQHSHSNETSGEIVSNVIMSNNVGVQIDIEYGPIGNLKLEKNAIIANNDGVELDYFNRSGFKLSIRENVISLNNVTGVKIEGGVLGVFLVNVTQNYVTFNGANGIQLDLWKKEATDIFFIEENDVHDNGRYDFKLGGLYLTRVDYTLSAGNNYWGATDNTRIDEKIYDFFDDHKLGKVDYIPALNSPLESRYPDQNIDYIKPTLSIYQLSNGTFIRSSNVNLTWNGHDAGSGIDRYVVKLDNNPEVNVGMDISYTFENVSEGSHQVYIFVFDKRGNRGEGLINIGVDLTPPIVSDISLANASEIRTSVLNLTWSGFDDVSGIDHFEIKLDRDAWMNLAGESNYAFAYLTDGAHKIVIKALDKAQNAKEITIYFSVNTSLLWRPGWIDDAAFFGGISMVVVISVYYFFLRERRLRVKETKLSSV